MKKGFGHFLEFGASVGLDIAYWDTVEQCPWFGNGNDHVGHDQLCIIGIIYAENAH